MNYNTFNELFTENSPEQDYWELADLHGIKPVKHICFLISDQHLIPHGGIGQFCKSFIELCDRLQYRIDIVLDKKPTNNFLQDNRKVRFYYPTDPLGYNDHTGTFAYNDNVNYEKCYNFQKAIKLARKHNSYDLYISNTTESVISAYTNGCKPLVSYTHLYRSIFRDANNGKFLESFHNMQDKMNEMPDIIVGTQSANNKQILDKFVNNCVVLPMPITERELLLPSRFTERSGVLYIGRWEDGKRPKLFVDLCHKANLPIKILTNTNGAKKFTEYCDSLNITDYDIRANITGKEKVDFITSSALHLNCSKLESYCFAMYECIGHMPCIVLDDQAWSNNFDSRYIVKVPKIDCVTTLRELYDCINMELFNKADHLYYVNQLDFDAQCAWRNLLY